MKTAANANTDKITATTTALLVIFPCAVRASHDGKGASGSSSSTGKSGDGMIILERHICCWCKRLFGAIMLRLKGTNNVDSLMWLSVKDVG